jgi:hypothetical protein
MSRSIRRGRCIGYGSGFPSRLGEIDEKMFKQVAIARGLRHVGPNSVRQVDREQLLRAASKSTWRTQVCEGKVDADIAIRPCRKRSLQLRTPAQRLGASQLLHVPRIPNHLENGTIGHARMSECWDNWRRRSAFVSGDSASDVKGQGASCVRVEASTCTHYRHPDRVKDELHCPAGFA